MSRRFFVSVMAAALLFAWTSPLSAHPGHAKKVLGTVSVIDGNHVEIKAPDGKVTMHMLDAKTKIKRGTMVVKASDIKVGDRVVLTVNEEKDKAGKAIVTVTEVQLSASPAVKPKAKESTESAFMARNPGDAPEMAWKAHQHFADGTVSDWTGPSSKRPASVTKLVTK